MLPLCHLVRATSSKTFKVLLRNNNNIVKDSESDSCLRTCCSRQRQVQERVDSKKTLSRSAVCSLSSLLKVTKMPFMLQSCGHAMRFAAPDGICRRCSSDMEGISSNESSGSEMRVNAENEVPDQIEKHEDELMNGAPTSSNKKSFGDRVSKLLGPVVYSEGPEITESFVHVARSMSTFTAAERADFIFHLVIMYCEARREDQPKIQGLLSELAKKNVLAKTHILQSAKRLAAEVDGLLIDWPNVYSCTIELLGALLVRSDEKDTVENLTAFRRAFKENRGFLQCLYSTYPNLGLETSQSTPKKRGSMGARTSFSERRASMGNQTLPFFRSPVEVKDRFVQPVGLRPASTGKPPAHVYTREEMLKLGEAVKKIPVRAEVLEAVRAFKNDSWVGDRDNQQLKRSRFVSESTAHNEGFNPTKRMLESTSPTFGAENGGSSRTLQPHPEKGHNNRNQFFGGTRQRYVSESHHQQPPSHAPSTSKSPTPAAGAAPRNVPEVSPRGKPVSPPSHRGAPGSKPRYNSVSTSSPVKMEPAGQAKNQPNDPPQATPAPHVTPHGPASRPQHSNGRPANAKPNKFLTALHVERAMETESGQPSPTLSPGVKGSWTQGSGMPHKGGEGLPHFPPPPSARPFGNQGANRHTGPVHHGQFRTGYSGAPRQAQPGSSEENWRRPVQP
ncbi:hypothetical protein RvY_11382 [Ramazzottius varieornatus]|uniref:Tardigrade-unique protein with predicted mitochondria targeting peptide 1 n=1 Tax=Ramazzottius varieornatus TaxID=947166 RepID=A0A0E4AVG4_RAMVA|nr:tardigrade-unique protein with predicted mitochondria targeting peptide 1 [Ramazzottius varieornatus]GAV00551.1 hypothetical protein RvY_11382 [Ramazzottius varieornatus]